MNPIHLDNDMTDQIPLQMSVQRRIKHGQDVCMRSRSVEEKLRVIVLEAMHSVGINMADNRLTIRHWKGKE